MPAPESDKQHDTLDQPTTRPAANPADRLLWGAEAIGNEINRTEDEAFYLLKRRLVDADKVGGRWVSTPRRLRRSIHGE